MCSAELCRLVTLYAVARTLATALVGTYPAPDVYHLLPGMQGAEQQTSTTVQSYLLPFTPLLERV